MSAIWGAVSLDNAVLPADTAIGLRQPYTSCEIDRFEEHVEADCVFGCGIQYFTPEAHFEKLPLTNDSYIFTADVMLDNRDELIVRLGMDESDKTIPDGAILCEMFAKFGEACLNDLLGAYAFVFYDKMEKRLSLVSDPTGNRCLHYRIHKDVLYFSTLIEPVTQVAGHEGVNERWISDFLALDNLSISKEHEETPYMGVYKVAPRQIVTWNGKTLEKRLYWQPDTSLLLLDNDEAYAELLRELLAKSVECLLRSDETGLLLSGGLDSTAVACYAAPMLRDKGKTLHTYTSVPVEGYVSTHPKTRVADESGDVLKTKAFLESKGCKLDCRFISLSGVNVWESRAAMIALVETPYKPLQNYLWLIEGQRMARSDGVRVCLNGGYGNVSISLNISDGYLNELLRKGKFIAYLQQAVRFGRVHRTGRKATILNALKIASAFYFSSTKGNSGATILKKSYISRESLDKHDIIARYHKDERKAKEQSKNYEKYRELLVGDQLFSIQGGANTRYSLQTGVICRDPLMDKRLIEFCVRLPVEQYARDGVPRRLVRSYLAPDMPAHVMSIFRRGLQSADFLDSVSKDWKNISEDLRRIYIENMDNPIVDCNRALTDIEALDNGFESVRDFDILRLGYTAMTLEFVQKVSARSEGSVGSWR